jgi:CubicO group peptidase (beta-lactamase class C family)
VETRPLPAELLAAAEAECGRLEVPGAAIGVLFEGTAYAGGVGVTNVDHPLPVTAETLFQVGSTTKPFTATAVMQLVEMGLVELDAPVRRYLPWFALASGADAERVTVRDLLTHHGGFAGDYFKDTGRGDDALERIVRKMARSPQLVPAGSHFSYCNSGFYVLGLIVAELSGRPYEQAVRERLLEPLGMGMSFFFPEECMVHRFAAGHVVTAEGPRPARPWATARSIAPGGGLISTVVDQLRWAAFHLGELEAREVLSPGTVAFMRQPQRPAGSMCAEIGISWMLDDAGGGERLVKHGGATNGQLSAFELVPGRRFAVTVLTNADTGREARQTIADRCQEYFLGFGKPGVPAGDAGDPAEAAELAGRYEATLAVLEVEAAPGGRLTIRDRAPERMLAEREHRPVPAPPAALARMALDRWVVADGPRRGERVEFLRDEAGRPAWLRWDGRLARRSGH